MTTATQNIITVEVPRVNLSALTKKLDKLAKKAAKLKSGSITYEVDPNFIKKTVTTNEITGEKMEVIYQKVTVTGDQPIVAGYAFSAALTSFPDAGNVVRLVPGETIPAKYFKTPTTLCEHCNTKRYRKEVYVVRNITTDTYKQVGSTCLKDFVGHGDPLAVAKYAEYLMAVKEMFAAEEEAGFKSAASVVSLDRFLAYVAQSIRLDGWTSRGDAYNMMVASTAEIAWNRMKDSAYTDEPTKADEEMAEAALEWGQSFEGSEAEFENNLYVISSFGAITQKEFGFAAYLVQGYIRAVEKAKYLAKKEKIVAFDAKVKSRFDVIATVDSTRTIDGAYGTSRLVKFDVEQEDGTIVQLVTFGSGNDAFEFEEGKTYLIRATVKGHEEYKGVPQTKVTRVKILQTIEKEANAQ